MALSRRRRIWLRALSLLLASYGFTAHSTSGNVTLAGKLKTNPAGASVAIEAPTGTCDVSAFKGLADTMVTYDCATVVP
jgi:hypothetical protein